MFYTEYIRGETCCFTGHRPQKLPWGSKEDDPRCVQFKRRIVAAVSDAYTDGFRHFLCGMAIGCDTWFCETLLEMRRFLPNIIMEAVIPCETQAERWSERDRSRYYRLLAQCDEVSTLQTAYTPGCMERRNKFMVDHSSLLLAAYSGEFGGTMQTIGYAVSSDVEVRYIEIGT